MGTLYDRLLQICKDQGIENPRPRDISSICRLSSGRPTQIKDEGEAAKIGAKTLQHLVSMGYSPDWIQEGKMPPRLSSSEGRPPKEPPKPSAEPDLFAITNDGKVLAVEAKTLKHVRMDEQKPVILAVDELELLLNYRLLDPIDKEKYRLRIGMASDIKRSEDAINHQGAQDRKSSE